MLLEYNQYEDYLSNEKFMKYFNSLKSRLEELFPTTNFGLDTMFDNIYHYYESKSPIDDTINDLYYKGKLFTITVSNGDS